ncbi:hypothetical protein LINPERHAP1_LOCUS26219 [Linum perenne]
MSRGPNWSYAEDQSLCRLWVEISEDGIIGNGQTLGDFWGRINNLFAAKGFGIERTILSLQSRWTHINNQCHLWNASLRRANATPTSGSNLHDVDRQTRTIFQADNKGKPFKLDHCWEILQYCSKFMEQFSVPVVPIPPMEPFPSTMPHAENVEPDVEANFTPFVLHRPDGRDKRRKEEHRILPTRMWRLGRRA